MRNKGLLLLTLKGGLCIEQGGQRGGILQQCELRDLVGRVEVFICDLW